MGQRVLILAAGVGSGHNIAASVLESSFQVAPDVDAVQRLDILESTNEVYRTLYDDGYFKLVEAAPWLIGWGYDANDPPFKLAKWVSLWDRINTTAAAKAIKEFRDKSIDELTANIKELLDGGEEASLRLNVDPKAQEIALELELSGAKGSKLAKDIQSIREHKSVVGGALASPNAAMSFTLSAGTVTARIVASGSTSGSGIPARIAASSRFSQGCRTALGQLVAP